MNKNLIKKFFLGVILSSFIIGTINFIVDPFQIYRKPTFYKTVFINSMYLNAGLIKNYDYDSVVIGSSMTENFIIDKLKELNFKKPIKLPISGGYIVEHSTILKSAISTKKVKNVLFGIDIFSLKTAKNRLPLYLYDNNPFNDYKYLLNIDTLKRSFIYPFLPLFLPKNHPRMKYNLMYQWQHNLTDKDFCEKKVIKDFLNPKAHLDNDKNQTKLYQERIKNFDKYVYKIVKNNPKIKFIFFYPPYSILTYKKLSKKALIYFVKTKIYINNKLIKLPNVKVFDFQIALNIISNLNNYKDITHYHQRINNWIVDQIKLNNYLIKKNIDYSNFIKYVEKYKVPHIK